MTSEYNPIVDARYLDPDMSKPIKAHKENDTGTPYINPTETDSAGKWIFASSPVPSNYEGVILIENGVYYYQTNYDKELNKNPAYVAVCQSSMGVYRYVNGYNTWRTTIKDPTIDLYERIIEFCETSKKKNVTIEDICRIAVKFENHGNHDVHLVFSNKTIEDYLESATKTLSIYKVRQYKGLFMIITSTEPENIIFCSSKKEET